MTNIFTSTFGNSAVSPSQVAFAEYTFSTNQVFYWPQFAAGQTNVVARFMNFTATVGSLDAAMPDATLVSTGYDVIINNIGAYDINITDYVGGAIATVPAGKVYYLLVADNTTQAGVWEVVPFGVGTSSAVASALAGAGLIAIANTLNLNLVPTMVSNSYSITIAARATLQVWTGGSGTITLPTAASVGAGFIFALANNGSGTATVATSGGNTIDGASTSVFGQTNSGFIVSDGTNWYTVGKGIQNTFAVTLLNLNVAGNSDVTETSAQAENIIQQFTGTLTGNINVIVPATVQLYYIFNNTSGAYTLTVKTASGTGIAVAQSAHTILYCDGTNVVNGYTATVNSTVTLSAGSANSPNLNFSGSGSTGIYSPTTDQFAITAGGYEVMNFISAASSVNYLQTSASATGIATSIAALGSDTNIGITLTPKGTGTVNIAKANLTGGTIDGIIIGGSSAAAITGTTITANTGFVGDLTGNVTGNCSGTSGSTTGNAATATALQNARTIGGVSFNGTANITVATATGGFTISGGDLSLGANNITMSGSLGATGTRLTKGWFIDLQVTNAIVGSVTGNAATATSATTATALATGRTIAITGDLAWTSPSFDGSGNVTAAGTLATVNSNVGSFTNANITVNAKGLVTAASSGSAPTNYTKAWANFAGSSGAITAGSANVSSVTRNGTGDYTVNFSPSMTDANYCTFGNCIAPDAGRGYSINVKNGTTPSTSAVTVAVKNSISNPEDPTHVYIEIVGN